MALRGRIKIYFDGGYRPCSGGMEMAVFVQGQCHMERQLGEGSAMEAEWRALHHAVRLAARQGLEAPRFLGDALGVILQFQGRARIEARFLDWKAEIEELAAPWGGLKLRHIKRQQNLAGIALAKLHPR